MFERVNVIGSSGSGKSFVASALSRRLALPLVRLDELRHGPNWSDVPEPLFRARVAAAAAGERWVMDGSYPSVRPAIWERADTVVWADLDLPLVMWQVVSRSLRDWITRNEPIPGNRERLRNFVQPWHPIRWAWSNHARFRAREQAWLADPRWAHLRVVRLRSRAEVDAFLAGLPSLARA